MSKKKKQVTLETMASTMEAGFKRIDGKIGQLDAKMSVGFKKVSEEIESLAVMTANSFLNTPTKDTVASKEDVNSIKSDLATLEQGQENIQLRLDSLAPHFEVRELTKRVKRLEDHTGLRHVIQRTNS